MQKRCDQPAMGKLITFEAAARTGSFTKAALELAVGQPAVSHAIRLLDVQAEPDWNLAAQGALGELENACALVSYL
jgi:hypothetical protein